VEASPVILASIVPLLCNTPLGVDRDSGVVDGTDPLSTMYYRYLCVYVRTREFPEILGYSQIARGFFEMDEP
jgi:hypothetical protein